jgi:hypothetical protein
LATGPGGSNAIGAVGTIGAVHIHHRSTRPLRGKQPEAVNGFGIHAEDAAMPGGATQIAIDHVAIDSRPPKWRRSQALYRCARWQVAEIQWIADSICRSRYAYP